ncbi:MAG: hypothetical protein WD904_10250 [Dehalococcoidia bacterium]
MKRLDQILEECIDAGISGRRSVEQSLALYPAVAVELEPLLRTALQVSGSFQSYSPPAAVEQRGLNRFLQDAVARRKIRHLAGTFPRPSRFSGFWRTPAFGGLSAAVGVLVIAVAVAAGGFNTGDGSGGTASSQPGDRSAPAVANVQSQVDAIRQRFNQNQHVGADDFEQLSRLLDTLENSASDLDANDEQVQRALEETIKLATEVADANPNLAAPVVQKVIDTTRDIAGGLGLILPGPIAGATTPTPTAPVETPTPAPTDEPTSEPTAPPTEPAPTETPAPTTDLRQPPGFLP